MSDMAEAIRLLINESGYSVDSVRQTIERALKAAYKRTYGTDENAHVVFNDDMSDVAIYSRKLVCDGVYNSVLEIELEDARKLNPDIQEGDEIDILEDPKTFDRTAVGAGKQTAHVTLNESFKNSLYNEFIGKKGEVIIGYMQRERNGNIFVDLGHGGRVEGYLPVKFQSKLEYYESGDRIKALIVDVKQTNSGIQLVLSRSDPRLVESILEKEVPEIAEGIVEVKHIVRDAGYRTKISVYTSREEIDPVGACVGLKGVRIQNIIRELSNEKVDILRYDINDIEYIKNSLSPAIVDRAIILNEEKRHALAIVEDSQFSIAIGRQGQNVRLANRLCGWNIDVKTEEQVAELDLSSLISVSPESSMFMNEEPEVLEINTVSELPGIDIEVAEILKENGIDEIQDFVEAYDNDSINIEGVSKEALDKIYELISDNVEFVEEDESEEESSETEESTDEATANSDENEEEEYVCPECGAKITLDMTHCPKCGVEFEFTDGE